MVAEEIKSCREMACQWGNSLRFQQVQTTTTGRRSDIHIENSNYPLIEPILIQWHFVKFKEIDHKYMIQGLSKDTVATVATIIRCCYKQSYGSGRMRIPGLLAISWSLSIQEWRKAFALSTVLSAKALAMKSRVQHLYLLADWVLILGASRSRKQWTFLRLVRGVHRYREINKYYNLSTLNLIELYSDTSRTDRQLLSYK